MTGVAKIAFKYGKSEAEAEQEVREYLMREGVVKEEVEEKKVAGVVRREANSRWQEVSSSKYTLPGVAVSDRCRRIVQRKRTGWKRKRWKKGRLGSGKAPPHSFAGSALTVAD